MQLRSGKSVVRSEQTKTKTKFTKSTDSVKPDNVVKFGFEEFHKTVSCLLNTLEILNKTPACESTTLYFDKLCNIQTIFELVVENIQNLKNMKKHKFLTIAFEKSLELTKTVISKSFNAEINKKEKIKTVKVLLILYNTRRELSPYIVEISNIAEIKVARDNITTKCIEHMFCSDLIGVTATNTNLILNYTIPREDMWIIKLNICLQHIKHTNPDSYLPCIGSYNNIKSDAGLMKIYNKITLA